MTRGELVSVVSAKAGLSKEADHEELSLMRAWANEGVVEVLLETSIFLQIGDMALTSGTAEYRLDPTVLAIVGGRGTTPSGSGHYDVVTLDEMIARQASGAVSPTFRKMVAQEGDLLIVYPTPSTGESFRYYYVPRPSAMTEDAHDPSDQTYGGIPTQHHKAIQYYMLWQASEYDEKRLPHTPKDYFDMFSAECGKVRKRKRKLRSRTLVRPRVGYPGIYRIGRRNDQYP